MNEMIKSTILKKISEGVYVTESEKVRITNEMIDIIERDCKVNKLKRSRINCHKNSESKVHEMFLALSKETDINPHMHSDKDESFYLLRGILAIGIMDNKLPILKEKIILSYDLGMLYVRIPAGTTHLIMPISETCVVHEITSGPFRRNEAKNPEWFEAEDGADTIGGVKGELHDHALKVCKHVRDINKDLL